MGTQDNFDVTMGSNDGAKHFDQIEYSGCKIVIIFSVEKL